MPKMIQMRPLFIKLYKKAFTLLLLFYECCFYAMSNLTDIYSIISEEISDKQLSFMRLMNNQLFFFTLILLLSSTFEKITDRLER